MAGFAKALPAWNKVGAGPTPTKQNEGWLPGEHPPADWFDWHWNLTYLALQELQQNAIHRDGSGNFTGQVKSTLATGTAPFSVVSTTLVANLNADSVDGFHMNQDVRTSASPAFAGLTVPRLTANVAQGTAPFTVTSQTLVTNLNADMLDGVHASAFLQSDSPVMTGTPKVPTAAQTVNDTTAASTAYVRTAVANVQPPDISGLAPKDAPAFTGAASFAGTVAFNNTASFNNSTGTKPFNVTSTTVVTNLNADMVDGSHASASASGTTVAVRNGLGELVANGFRFDANNYVNMNAEKMNIYGDLGLIISGETVDISSGDLMTIHALSMDFSALEGITFTGQVDITGTLGATNQIYSTVANGTAPFVVSSGTKVFNLNADSVDGFHLNQDVQTTASPTFAGLSNVDNSANITASGQYSGNAANETVIGANSQFDLLYKTSTGYAKAQGNADTTAPCVALALDSGTVTGTRKILKRGLVRCAAWAFTPGQLVYLSPSSAGGITNTLPTATGNRVQIVGYAETLNTIYFNPDYTVVTV